MIDAAEDRNLFRNILDKIGSQPKPHANSQEEAELGEIIPILLRPSFVLGGRGMFIVYDMLEMKQSSAKLDVTRKACFIRSIFGGCHELDVDCISDGETTLIGGMLHVEFAGVIQRRRNGDAHTP